MRFHSCWLLADEADAAAIRSTVPTGERPLTDWPHLILKGVDAMDVNKLERILRPRQKGVRSTVGGKLLAEGKRTATP
jgi:hypothetical protein